MLLRSPEPAKLRKFGATDESNLVQSDNLGALEKDFASGFGVLG